MKRLKSALQWVFPFPDFGSAAQQADWKAQDEALYSRVKNLSGIDDEYLSVHLISAQRIVDEEAQRKAGAESRATTLLAAIAALIPLTTWSLGTAPPACEPNCGIWTGFFTASVIYFAASAFWCLKTLAVARYFLIGVEDFLQLKERVGKPERALIKETLKIAALNREPINLKLTYLKVAQRSFFYGLMVMASLLIADPWMRFGLFKSPQEAASQMTLTLSPKPSN